MLYSSLRRTASASLCGVFAIAAFALLGPTVQDSAALKVDARIYNLSGHILTLQNADTRDYPFAGSPPLPQYTGEYPTQMRNMFAMIPTKASKRILSGSIGRVKAEWPSLGFLTQAFSYKALRVGESGDVNVDIDTRPGVKHEQDNMFSVTAGSFFTVTKVEKTSKDHLHLRITVRAVNSCMAMCWNTIR